MTTKEAIQAMLDGKKVRVIDWLETEYIELSPCGNYTDEVNEYYQISITDKEWEIYEEPKPKQTVVIEKWLCLFDSKIFSVLDIEKSQLSLFCAKFNYKTLKLLDTYEVEL